MAGMLPVAWGMGILHCDDGMEPVDTAADWPGRNQPQPASPGLDPNTMSLQYLEVMRSLASSESTKWLIPTELTQFISSFAGQLTNGQGQN